MTHLRFFFAKILLILIVVVISSSSSFSQIPIGQSEVKSFTRNQYEAGTQNWAMLQDKYKRLYVANNEGLLVFNGTKWQVFPMPNKTILRSIRFGADGKIYAGAQDELGYFTPDNNGTLRFTSLKNLLPQNEKEFTDVWQIVTTDKDVFFRTSTNIFKLSADGKFSSYKPITSWVSLFNYQNQAMAQDEKVGLLIYQNGQWQKFIGKDSLPLNFLITDMVAYKKDTSLLCTRNNGLYLLTKNKLIPFSFKSSGLGNAQYFTCLSIINDSSFWAGTYFNGAYRISKQGKIIENISTKNGLPNNTVRCILTDNGYTWSGFDNGIAYFTFNNPIKHINPSAFNNGVGYGVKDLNGDLYFALSTGLQWLPINANSDLSTIAAEPKSILGGLTWNLSVLNNQLLAGRDDGFWLINNHQPLPVSQSTGYWTYKAINNTASTIIAAGNYFGIELFEYNAGKFIDKGILAKFTESSRYIETDNDNIWISHPYRGIYKINIGSKAVTIFNQQNGLPSDLDNHVFKIKNKILFATTSGIYTYDATKNAIVPAKEYIELFGNLPIRYLKEDEKGNIWFVKDKMVGVADFRSGKPTIHYIPELKNKVLSGFENIFTYNTENIIIGSENGFYHLNYEKYLKNKQPFTAFLTLIKTIGIKDSVLHGGYNLTETADEKKLSIPYRLNSLHFDFAASQYSQYYDVEFSYFLEGFDKTWSEWTTQADKDYTNLPAGKYIFNIKARTSPSHESAIYSYTFSVNPPWYKSIWAYLFYSILLIALLYALLKYQERQHQKKQEARRLADRKKFEEKQKQMAFEHQLELEQSEKELIRLTNQNLEAEVQHKTNELASVTMNLVQKKEFILKLKTELQQLQKNTKVGDDNPELKKLLKVLAEEEKLNEEWEHFSQHFNSVHGNFLTILKNKFPSLKPHELRLCAYLRMNLSSKEIAPLMSISVRGVEISRYRLRKKINLSTEANLVQYLLDLESQNKPE